jgi:hypothetical protein
MIRHDIDDEGLTTFARFVVAGFAVIALVAAQLILSAAIHGTNYSGGDGKLAQATILTHTSLPATLTAAASAVK